MDENYVYEQIARLANIACQRMNSFSSQILKTRGGRIGSGMGALLEALWGYMMNQIILEETELDCEIKQESLLYIRLPQNSRCSILCLEWGVIFHKEYLLYKIACMLI